MKTEQFVKYDLTVDFITFDNGKELIYHPNNKTAAKITKMYFGIKRLAFILPYSLVDEFEIFAAKITVITIERR
jgi:hypothetical protein